MPYVLTRAVEGEVLKTFAPADIEYVREQLMTRTFPLDQGGPPPRIHIAILWLSKGDRPTFDRAMQIACEDWRDTLVAAGLGNLGWRSTLQARGVDLSEF